MTTVDTVAFACLLLVSNGVCATLAYHWGKLIAQKKEHTNVDELLNLTSSVADSRDFYRAEYITLLRHAALASEKHLPTFSVEQIEHARQLLAITEGNNNDV